MSDGGDGQNSSTKSGPTGGDDFGRGISKVAVAQICESTGFQSSQCSALDALADVAIRFICDLGKTSHFYASISGRTECNVFDLVQGLEDLGSSHGFNGASDVQHCLVGSGVVREIARYVSLADEVPFARPVPRFPIPRFIKPTPSFGQIGEVPAGNHIPHWLPAFPDPHTYVHTPVWRERTTDPRTDKLELARQRRKAERSLLSLQQRLASSGASGFVTAVDGGASKGKQVAVSNPFLAPPLPYGEKEVSEIVVQNDAANDVATVKSPSVLETFTPAIVAAKAGTFDSGIGEKRIITNGRPKVHFKFGIDKKSVAVPLASAVLGVKTDSWFLRDDEKDDKKRRAEMILKEAMENPEELTQL